MGIGERKQRDREKMRAEILQAAMVLFVTKGFEETSIRAIAKRIEYSPATIYLYYKDKQAIIHDLHLEGFNRMGKDMSVLTMVRDPFERLLAMGRAYVKFAMENPDFYELMFIKKVPLIGMEKPEDWKAGALTFEALVAVVQECQARGRFVGKEPVQLSFLIWSCVHGICSLNCCERLDIIKDIPHDQLISTAMDYLNDFLDKL
jgi:AcrR family transcriptional regulator